MGQPNRTEIAPGMEPVCTTDGRVEPPLHPMELRRATPAYSRHLAAPRAPGWMRRGAAHEVKVAVVDPSTIEAK